MPYIGPGGRSAESLGSQSQNVAKRALHQAAISRLRQEISNETTDTQKCLRNSLRKYVEPPIMRVIAPPRLILIIQKVNFNPPLHHQPAG